MLHIPACEDTNTQRDYMLLLDCLQDMGEEVTFDTGRTVAFQHAPVVNVHLLLEGELELGFHTPRQGLLPVGRLTAPDEIIGFSMLSKTGQHNVEVRALRKSRLIQCSVQQVQAAFAQFPELVGQFKDAARQSVLNRFDALCADLPDADRFDACLAGIADKENCQLDDEGVDTDFFRLNAARAVSMSFGPPQELGAVDFLLFHHIPQLSTFSKLHMVHALLSTAETTSLGFAILDEVMEGENALEACLATICRHILVRQDRENQYYLKKKQLYESIAKAPASTDRKEIEDICHRKVNEMFEHVDLVVEGEENLPDQPGHIFIYNHFANSEYYTLPEDYQISVDSNFVSSYLLYKKYGSLGSRVVRISTSREFSHQSFYSKFDFMFVTSHPTDVLDLTAEERRAKRHEFYDQAVQLLASGRNFVISPEGDTYSMEDSPGPLKAGAFTIALKAKPEPYIVPITLVNFDKRVNYATLKCRVQKPFKVSDFITDPDDKEAMRKFLLDYRKIFARDIQDLLHA